MLKRIEGGYHVDTVEHNCMMVNKFAGAMNVYKKKLKKGFALT